MASPYALANFSDADSNRIALALAARKMPTQKKTGYDEAYTKERGALQDDLNEYGASTLPFFDAQQNELIGALSEQSTAVIQSGNLGSLKAFHTKAQEQNNIAVQASQILTESLETYTSDNPYFKSPKIKQLVKQRANGELIFGDNAVDINGFDVSYVGQTVSTAITNGSTPVTDIINVDKLQTDIRSLLADKLTIQTQGAAIGSRGVNVRGKEVTISQGTLLQTAIANGALSVRNGQLVTDVNGIIKFAGQLGVSKEEMQGQLMTAIDEVVGDPQLFVALDMYVSGVMGEDITSAGTQPGDLKRAAVISFIQEYNVSTGDYKTQVAQNITNPQFEDPGQIGFSQGTDFSASANSDGTINIVPNRPGSSSRLGAPVAIDISTLGANEKAYFNKQTGSVEANVFSYNPANNSFTLNIPTDDMSPEQLRQAQMDGTSSFTGQDGKEYITISMPLDNANRTRTANAVGQESWTDVTTKAPKTNNSKPKWRPNK